MIKLKKNLGYVAALSGLTVVGLSQNVYAAKNHEGVCEVETKTADIIFNVSGTSSRKKLDLMVILDTSSSMVENFTRELDSAKALVESLEEDDVVTFAHYNANMTNSYNNGAKDSFRGNMTKKLSKSQALAYLNKAKTYTVRPAGVQYEDFVKHMGVESYVDGSENVDFQTIFMRDHKQGDTISVIQFTDGWGSAEDIDRDFANWAKELAKTFMTVSYQNNSGANGGPTSYSISKMKEIGHPNIYDERQTPIDNAKIVKQFQNTGTEKSLPGGTFKVTAESGVTLKEVKLVGPGGKEETLTINNNSVNVNKEKLADGSYTLKVKADGLTPTTKKVVATATIGGKEVGKKELIFEGCENSVAGTDEEKKLEDLPFETKYEEDENLSEGEKKTKREGVVGSKEIKKTWKTLNGKRQGEPTVIETKLKDPVDKVVLVGVGGTKEEKEVVNIPYDTHYEDDNNSLEGVRTRKQEGVTGSKEITRVWKTIKGVKKGEPKVTEKELRAPVDEIIQIGTLGYRFERLSNIVDPNYMFDYHDGTRYGKVIGTTLGHHGLTETTKKYKTIKGVVTGEPEVNTKTLLEKLDTDKKLGTHGKNVYTETMIEPKSVIYVNDPTLEEGKEITVTPGQDGLKERVSVWETYKGYRQGDAKVIENVIKEKVDMVIRRGTKKKETVQPKKEVVGPKVNEINKGVENGLVSESKPIVAPKVEVPKPVIKEEVKPVVIKPMFAFDSFFKEISETSDLISRLITGNVNEEKRVSDMVETDKKVMTSNELLDLIKLFIGK